MSTPSPPGFAHYPDPIEGPAARYEPEPGKNPVLRGMSLWMAGEIISRSGYLQRVFWANAGFGTIKDMTVLDEIPYTFQPVVTPLGKTGPMLELGPELRSSQYGDVAGRYLTASDYHALFTAGKTTPLRVAEALLALKRAGGRHSDVWADSHGQDGRALEAARAATQRFAAGRPLGILDGVPVGVKDDVDVAGYINHNGLQHDARVPWFRACERSAWPVRMLQEAGAVVVGKLRMHELGSNTSGLNVRQGTPSNPVNDAYYPGGSSSGPAAAVAAGLMPICVATDAGGSVRIPASFTGVYGLKTSHHRTGVMNSSMCVTGPMAATVADLTIAYRLMAQPDAECAIQGRFALSLPPALSARRVMGIYRDWWKLADGRVADVCDRAVDWFARQRGYEVVDIAIPHLAEAQLAHGAICLTEMAETARRRTPDPADWLTLCGPANKILLSVGSQTPAADYLKLNALRTLLMRHLAHLFQKYPGLLIITPTTPLVGWPKTPGDEAYGVSDANLAFRNMMFIFLANMTGTPSLSAPVGYVDPDQGQGRLPIGLMATGEWGSEEQLLSWAAEAEGYLHRTNVGGRRRPDTWVDVADLADPARDVKAH